MKTRSTGWIFLLGFILSCSHQPIARKSQAKTVKYISQDISFSQSSIAKTSDTLNLEQVIDENGQVDTVSEVDEEQLVVEPDTGEEMEELITEEVQHGGLHLPSKNAFLDIVINDQVKGWINYFTIKDRARFQRFIDNGEKYRSVIEKTFESYNLPKELFFVGLIESGYYLGASSRASAVGPWQFIKGTGKRYGLKVTQNVDERRDIFKATHSAAKYMKDLYQIFGKWELALSGYNAGEFGIMRRIKRSRITDFYALSAKGYLPKETANYVPKVLATMIIYKNAQKYGFKVGPQPNPFANTAHIELNHSLSLRTIEAKLALSNGTLASLNPELVSEYTPHFPSKAYKLRVPDHILSTRPRQVAEVKNMKGRISYRKTYVANSSSQSRLKDRSFRSYRIKKGDTLHSIAAATQSSPRELARLNKIKNGKILLGQNLKIPAAARKEVYVVRHGDNLTKIAKDLGISKKHLMASNNIKNEELIYPGQRIIVKAE